MPGSQVFSNPVTYVVYCVLLHVLCHGHCCSICCMLCTATCLCYGHCYFHVLYAVCCLLFAPWVLLLCPKDTIALYVACLYHGNCCFIYCLLCTITCLCNGHCHFHVLYTVYYQMFCAVDTATLCQGYRCFILEMDLYQY